ncbi:MAG: hypothetical protein NC901_02850 [Candidatus Omnitrophica bacterium]|nr:hypothetical protein [Candidatus Omnitrophota bacterium]
MELELAKNLVYATIIGTITNIITEFLKNNKNTGKKYILWFAWLMGFVVCTLLQFDFFYRIGVLNERYLITDYIFTGLLVANISRFQNKIYDVLRKINGNNINL